MSPPLGVKCLQYNKSNSVCNILETIENMKKSVTYHELHLSFIWWHEEVIKKLIIHFNLIFRYYQLQYRFIYLIIYKPVDPDYLMTRFWHFGHFSSCCCAGWWWWTCPEQSQTGAVSGSVKLVIKSIYTRNQENNLTLSSANFHFTLHFCCSTRGC